MSKLVVINSILRNPKKIIRILGYKGMLNWIPDKTYLKLLYKLETGEKLNLDNPESFNEKLQWLKLYDRKLNYSILVDKHKVREFISKEIGEKYLIPIHGIYESTEDIPWNALPNAFVLKCTHGSSSNIICKDKKYLDINKSKIKLQKWMNKNWFWFGREWPYKNLKPKLICEKFIGDDQLNRISLVDFKFYCFNGTPYYCQVIEGRGENETIDFYDMEWNHMPFNGTRPLPMADKPMNKPEKLDEMIEIAKKLSHNTPFLRVDLYYVKGKIYFGELTFFPSSGFGKFTPQEWNDRLGELIKLPYNV